MDLKEEEIGNKERKTNVLKNVILFGGHLTMEKMVIKGLIRD